MAPTPYRLPNDGKFRTINFSGGRSSAHMLYHLLDAHDGQLPNSTVVVFANTGVERAETLDFVHACEAWWKVPIVWLEFDYDETAAGGRRDPKVKHKVVNFDTASRQGEPFRIMTQKAKRLPNVVERRCTAELKVSTVERFCIRDLGWPAPSQRRVLGIRYDEPRRWRKALYEECRNEYPMVHAGVTKEMVSEFWNEQPFDLDIPSWQGNCTLCFMKGEANLMRTMREHPELAQWWIDLEEDHVDRQANSPLVNLSHAQFSKRWSYRQLFERAMNSPELPFDGAGEDDGELGANCGCTD